MAPDPDAPHDGSPAVLARPEWRRDAERDILVLLAGSIAGDMVQPSTRRAEPDELAAEQAPGR